VVLTLSVSIGPGGGVRLQDERCSLPLDEHDRQLLPSQVGHTLSKVWQKWITIVALLRGSTV
jgi:hypothetical protein